MGERYTPVKGDRVRVVLEVEVADPGSVTGKCLCTRKGLLDLGYLDGQHVVSIEKIEPPVEIFQPGDVVRAFHEGPDDFYVVGKDGYLELPSGRYYADPDTFKSFTSEHYEKVSLG